jgi:hypothetical protein
MIVSTRITFHLDIEEMKDRFGEHSSWNNLVVTEPNQGLTDQNDYSKEVMHSCISGPSTEVGPQLIDDNSCSPSDTHKNSIGSGEPRPIKRKLEVDHSEDLKLKKARGNLNTLSETEHTGHTVPKKTETKVGLEARLSRRWLEPINLGMMKLVMLRHFKLLTLHLILFQR